MDFNRKRDWTLVLALSIPAFLDVFLTLLGQSEEYWTHFFNGWGLAGLGSESALFGFGQKILEIHPLLFLGMFVIYFVALAFFILYIKSDRVALFFYWLLFILHTHGSFGWLSNYFDFGLLWMGKYHVQWVVLCAFYAVMIWIALRGQSKFLESDFISD